LPALSCLYLCSPGTLGPQIATPFLGSVWGVTGNWGFQCFPSLLGVDFAVFFPFTRFGPLFSQSGENFDSSYPLFATPPLLFQKQGVFWSPPPSPPPPSLGENGGGQTGDFVLGGTCGAGFFPRHRVCWTSDFRAPSFVLFP